MATLHPAPLDRQETQPKPDRRSLPTTQTRPATCRRYLHPSYHQITPKQTSLLPLLGTKLNQLTTLFFYIYIRSTRKKKAQLPESHERDFQQFQNNTKVGKLHPQKCIMHAVFLECTGMEIFKQKQKERKEIFDRRGGVCDWAFVSLICGVLNDYVCIIIP
ncbi:hypothetical protein SEVIR_3G011101v4 [Setaria viridis]